MNEAPLLTIVTVTYNAAAYISETLESVKKQTFTNYEHLVIDGASGDATCAVIRAFSNSKIHLLSEPDNGIYDAMNKGIKLAKGQWLYFLNAGDTFASSHILTDIFNGRENNHDLIYGKVITKNEPSGVNYTTGQPLTLASFFYTIPINHQGVFFHRSTFTAIGNYNLSYKILADLEWLIRYFKQEKNNAVYVDTIIAEYETVGFSYNNRARSLSETLKYSRSHFPLYTTILNYLLHPLMVLKIKLIALLKGTALFKTYRKWRFG
ncbi:MAG: glycosyltransferase [Bacteroidia bacterium]|nr:glycosyltransferase [Bacteroidia bacterium]